MDLAEIAESAILAAGVRTSMHPYQHAQSHPERPAFVVADRGLALSYRELDEGSNRVARLLRALGLDRKSVV